VALIDLKIDPSLVKRAVVALERIAEELGRALPEKRLLDITPAPPENLTEFDAERECEREREEEREKARGVSPSR